MSFKIKFTPNNNAPIISLYTKTGQEIKALIDTGSTLSVIDSQVAFSNKMHFPITNIHQCLTEIIDMGGKKTATIFMGDLTLYVNKECTIPIVFDNITIKNLPIANKNDYIFAQILVGNNILSKYKMCLNFDDSSITMK